MPTQPMPTPYQALTLSRAELESLPGATLLEFGTNWCSWCQGAQPLVEAALAASAAYPGGQGLRHLKEEDGRGRPLGRSFGVKLWPTLVVLRDGRELARVVRPGSTDEIARLLAALTD
jgi:thioredoxin 1